MIQNIALYKDKHLFVVTDKFSYLQTNLKDFMDNSEDVDIIRKKKINGVYFTENYVTMLYSH